MLISDSLPTHYLLAARPTLKIVLMSATVDPSAFQRYFAGAVL